MKRKREISLHTLYTKYVVIDHVKEDEKSNNTLENLNPTTTKGNNKKSARLNPGRMKNTGTIPIQGKKIGETEWVPYSGATEAARILNFYKSNITKVCKGKLKQTGGYVFRYKDDPDLPGEIWVENKHVGILVSNLGRVKSLTKTKGYLSNNSIYYNIKFNRKIYRVHRLVCQAFKWELVQQQFEQSTYTDIYSCWNALQVDHIDKNKTNNHIDNLQPLTSKEHAEKTDNNNKKSAKSRSKPILGKKDGDWVPYSGLNQAARELKDISYASIHICCDTGKTINGYQFKYAPDPDLEGEIWKDIPQEFFKHSVKGWRVSNKGRVQSKSGVKSYGVYHLNYRRFGKDILVHRAVAAAFMQDQIIEVLRSQHVL